MMTSVSLAAVKLSPGMQSFILLVGEWMHRGGHLVRGGNSEIPDALALRHRV